MLKSQFWSFLISLKLSQQYYFFPKLLILINLIFIAPSCVLYDSFMLGDIKAFNRVNGQGFLMNYHIYKGSIFISGKLENIGAISGRVLDIKSIRALERKKHPWLKKDMINNYIRTSYARLSSDAGLNIDCYITQNNPKRFKKGGFGTCYGQNGIIFDVHVIPR